MLILRDLVSIARLTDPEVRALIEQRLQALSEFDDCALEELVTFIVVEPGDTLYAVDASLGFPILDSRFELIEEHAGYYEIVYVLSDDGFGIEVFVSKHPGVAPELIAMCIAHTTPSREQPDS